MSPAPPANVWQIAPPRPADAADLAAATGLSALTAQLLLNRKVGTPGDVSRFLCPALADLHDPHTLPDMEKAVDRLARAIETHERIFLHGDYDADGVTSAALCVRALSSLGGDVVGYVPKRSDGYDLQIAGVDRAVREGATVIMTADCGSCALLPVAYAREKGIDVIVTDHHRPGPVLPDAVAVVNPYREDATAVLFQELCGAGVAFKVLDALVARIRPEARVAFRHNFVDLAALGTVADVTSLAGENRILVSHGLGQLAQAKKTGLRALMLALDMLDKPLDTQSISFFLAPHLNAAGRMGDADLAFRLLTTRDPDEAESLAVQMTALAARSREESARVTAEALTEALLPHYEDRRVLVLAREAWGMGVIGIAATRIAEHRRRPVILMAYDKHTDHYHGSGRTWGSFNLHAALHGCADLLGKWGGHSAAAGVSVPAGNLDQFRDRIHDLAGGHVSDEAPPPVVEIDLELSDARALTYGAVEEIERLAPFGRGNPEPAILTRGARVLNRRRVGQDGAHGTLVVRLPGQTNGIKVFWRRGGEASETVDIGDEIDLVYQPRLNEFRGVTNVELTLKDLQIVRKGG